MLRPALAVVAALLFVSASSCRSRCASDDDCVKACQCSGTDWCAIGLLCENTFCEGEEAIPCNFPNDHFCRDYGNQCGGRRCDSEDDCKRTCRCQKDVTPDNSNTQRLCCFQHDFKFGCNQDSRLCNAGYERTCDDICNNDVRASLIGNQCEAHDNATNEGWRVITCPTTNVAPAGPGQ